MFTLPIRYTLSFSLLTLVCLIWYVFIYVSFEYAIDRYIHQYELLAAKQPHMSTITDGIASLKKEKHFLTKQLEQHCKKAPAVYHSYLKRPKKVVLACIIYGSSLTYEQENNILHKRVFL